MNKTIGIYAHVDAGKTTFSEQVLYMTGGIRDLGRVDYETSHLDTDEIEKSRGITIFAGQAMFEYNGDTFFIIDTPGHVDFSPEAERTILALDYAILIISGGVQSHSVTLFKLLEKYNIPTFIFVNKADMEGFDIANIMGDISKRLTSNALYIKNKYDILNTCDYVVDFVTERDDEMLEKCLEGECSSQMLKLAIAKLIKNRKCFLTMHGSALKGVGIKEFFEAVSEFSYTEYLQNEAFEGSVYKIRYDNKGTRLTFIKALKGSLKVKEELFFEDIGEKINDIRFYNGDKYESRGIANAGEIFAVTGLKNTDCGSSIKGNIICKGEVLQNVLSTALESRVEILDGTDNTICLSYLRKLEEEEPLLAVDFVKETGDILVRVMGKIQLEVLKQVVKNRYNVEIDFGKPNVQYRETIASSVVGYGHYEPLRHYAEVQLRIEPIKRGLGIEFKSECDLDTLPINYQNLIKTHVFEKQHKGILTGSPITDIRVVLQIGKAHLKHTSGGDFREATYRGIRQGLEKADNILLEPFYRFEICAPNEYAGRIMNDVQKMRGEFEPIIQDSDIVYINGRAPVETMMDYQTELMSFSKGRGSISLVFEGYDICEDYANVIEKIAYNKDADKENTSASVFCAKGAGFVVNWKEAEEYMHTKK